MPVRTGWRASASSTRSRSPRGLRSLRAAGCGGCSSWTGMCTTAMGRRPSSRRTRPSSSSRCTASGAASSLGPAPRAAWAAAPLQAEPSTCPSGARGWGMPSTWPRSTRCCCRSREPSIRSSSSSRPASTRREATGWAGWTSPRVASRGWRRGCGRWRVGGWSSRSRGATSPPSLLRASSRASACCSTTPPSARPRGCRRASRASTLEGSRARRTTHSSRRCERTPTSGHSSRARPSPTTPPSRSASRNDPPPRTPTATATAAATPTGPSALAPPPPPRCRRRRVPRRAAVRAAVRAAARASSSAGAAHAGCQRARSPPASYGGGGPASAFARGVPGSPCRKELSMRPIEDIILLGFPQYACRVRMMM
mmetsp:Transcript_45865/g.147686  ORF Transcript_45865/g.147686 Transcript_45865/m.147686 type:complete len:368 (-) Transcript_45865:89-1192(-)